MKSSGFLLNEKQEIQIEAVGANIRDEHFMMSNAWILNADSRDVVWEMTEANSRRKSRELREYRDKITLEKGRFEIYYAVFPSFHYHDLWSFVRFFLDGSDYDDFDEKIFKDFQIVVRGNGKELHDGE
ncbi:MAG: hypothetical protein GWN16_09285, partial [Calditrichae bacterium]|nr:hypothetical protein [Calditrichia bacterium]